MKTINDTIIALATASGSGAIAIIRLSGRQAFEIAQQVFTPHSQKQLSDLPSHSVHLGYVKRGEHILDECLATLFKGTRSYTGEPVVEFSCHGSPYIQQEIIKLCVEKGARIAQAGEFTLRAFINGKMDLSQAEAVADLIASDSEAAHQVAMQQMRGGFTNEIKILRDELLNFASLIELELDFSEEDVEFADRSQFQSLLLKIQKIISRLIDSFAMGNVIKNGIPVAIVGEPNVGKSTLLNALLNEERAIVSDIAGTTRDTIEDEIAIGGIPFRFIDTAGIRETTDKIESIGIQKAHEKMERSQIIIYLFDSYKAFQKYDELTHINDHIHSIRRIYDDKKFMILANKSDLISSEQRTFIQQTFPEVLFLSAKNKDGILNIENQLLNFVNTGVLHNQDTIVTNSRHYEALLKAQSEINRVQEGLLGGLSGDLLAIDIRQALYHFGEITGEITNDEVLGNIFKNFCIGK